MLRDHKKPRIGILGSMRGGEFFNSRVNRTLAAFTDVGKRAFDIPPVDAIKRRQLGVIHTHMSRIDAVRAMYDEDTVDFIVKETVTANQNWIKPEDCIDHLIDARVPFYHTTVDEVVKLGSFERIRKLHENGYWCTRHGADNAAQIGHLEMLQFIYDQGARCTKQGVFAAILTNDLDAVKFLIGKGHEITSELLDSAIFRCDLPMLKFMIDDLGTKPSNSPHATKRSLPMYVRDDACFEFLLERLRGWFPDELFIHMATASKQSGYQLQLLQQAGVINDLSDERISTVDVECIRMLGYLIEKGHVVSFQSLQNAVVYGDIMGYQMLEHMLCKHGVRDRNVANCAVANFATKALVLCYKYGVHPTEECVVNTIKKSRLSLGLTKLIYDHGDINPRDIVFGEQDLLRTVDMETHCFLACRGAVTRSNFFPLKPLHLQTPEMLQQYHEAGVHIPDATMAFVLLGASLETLKYAHEHMGFTFATNYSRRMLNPSAPRYETLSACDLASMNSAERLAYVHEKCPGERVSDDGIRRVVQARDIDILEVALQRVQPGELGLDMAFLHEYYTDIRWLKLLLPYGLQLSHDFADLRASDSSVEFVRYLRHEMGFRLTTDAVRNAITAAKPEMLKYLLEEEGIPWVCDEEAFAAALYKRSEEVVEIALRRGFRTLRQIDVAWVTKPQFVGVLKLMLLYGVQFDYAEAAELAFCSKNLKGLELLYAHGARCDCDRVEFWIDHYVDGVKATEAHFNALKFLIQNTPTVQNRTTDPDIVRLFRCRS